MMTRKLLLLLLGIVVFVAGCDGAGSSPTAPVDFDSRDAQQPSTILTDDDTVGSEIETVPYRSYVIAALGDSITAGEGAYLYRNGYPAILEELLRNAGYNVVIYNEGIPGAHSGLIANRFNRDTVGADIALIMVGTNDISSPSLDDPGDNRTIENIRRAIQKALMAGIVPVLGMIPPKRAGDIYAHFNPRIEGVNAQIAALAAEYNLAVVDTYSAILNNGGNILYSDKHHFNDQGYRVLANQWYHVLTTEVMYRKY